MDASILGTKAQPKYLSRWLIQAPIRNPPRAGAHSNVFKQMDCSNSDILVLYVLKALISMTQKAQLMNAWESTPT